MVGAVSTRRRVGSGDEGGGGLNPAGSASETIRRGEELYRVLAEQLPNVAVLVFDDELRLLLAVGEALLSYGVRAAESEGRPLGEAMEADAYNRLEELCRAVLGGERRTIEQASPSGERCFRVHGKPLTDAEGRVWGGLVLAQDISDMRDREQELRRHAEQLADLAHRDALTRLPNRTLFRDRLGHALARAQRDGQEVAVIFVDLDRFKDVNDTFGHDAGDRLLQQVAARLRAATRDADTVARLGGDEFAVVVEGIRRDGGFARALDRVLAAFGRPVMIDDGEEVLIRLSAGVAVGPRDGTSADELLVAADRAMYRAKETGGGGHRFYDAEMQERSRERLRMEAELHHALRRDELVLHYQPAVDLQSGQIVSVEALVRWNHPSSGLLAPHQFIALAEQTGQAAEITEWVLNNACQQIKRWQAAGIEVPRVAVNSYARDVKGGLSALVAAAVQRSGVAAERLEIDVTERLLAADDAVADEMLTTLKALGVSIALDDFGTGYSSLARLSPFPVDAIKIDRSFVAQLEASAAITTAIIALGHNLGLSIVAEGVETDMQLQWLRQAGCDAASGYLISRPQPPERLELHPRASALGFSVAGQERGSTSGLSVREL